MSECNMLNIGSSKESIPYLLKMIMAYNPKKHKPSNLTVPLTEKKAWPFRFHQGNFWMQAFKELNKYLKICILLLYLKYLSLEYNIRKFNFIMPCKWIKIESSLLLISK